MNHNLLLYFKLSKFVMNKKIKNKNFKNYIVLILKYNNDIRHHMP